VLGARDRIKEFGETVNAVWRKTEGESGGVDDPPQN
jgi:hypothetical protein